MNKIAGTILLASFFSLALVSHQQRLAASDLEGQRHFEPTGGFSFIPPAGWQVREYPGMKYKMAFGPKIGGFGANINVVDEAFTGSLEAYADTSKAGLKKLFASSRVLQQDAFTTTNGLSGIRLVTENEMNGNLLRQTFFLFAGSKRVFVVTCTASANGGENLDTQFVISMDSFRFENREPAMKAAVFVYRFRNWQANNPFSSGGLRAARGSETSG